MAKGARASSVKANNLVLKKNVFGPVEQARNARLHAKLAAIIAAPKPSQLEEGQTMETSDARITAAPLKSALKATKQSDDMEVDESAEKPSTSTSRVHKKKKSDNRRSAIVFPKYKAGKKVGLKVRKARRS